MLGALPPEQRPQVEQQLAAVAAQPDWLPLVGAYERLWALAFHVAMSVIVLQVFRRGGWGWPALAIVVHALVNFVAVALPTALGLEGLRALLVPEAMITVAGLASLWVIWRLREDTLTPHPPLPQAAEGEAP